MVHSTFPRAVPFHGPPGSLASVLGQGGMGKVPRTLALLPPWHREPCVVRLAEKNKLYPHIHKLCSAGSLAGLRISHKPCGAALPSLYPCSTVRESALRTDTAIPSEIASP